jgi:hypothetical protein
LIAFREFKLNNCQIVGAKLAAGDRCLPLPQIPNDNVSVLLFLRFAGTGRTITLVTGGDAKNFESMAIKFLLLRPECPAHQYVLNWWLHQVIKHMLCLVLCVTENAVRIKI